MIERDMYPSFTPLKLGQLGEYFGETSHVIGRWLKEMGVRLPNGEPTEEAKDAGVAVLVVPPDGSHVFWVWDKEKTLTLLERAGHQRLTPPHADGPAPTKLLGPFTARPNGGDGFEIVDANGIVGIWCRGEWLSGVLVKLLNVCHRNNLFFG